MAAKDYVVSKLGADWVVPTLWHGVEVPPSVKATLEPPFVVKSNHGSMWNHFVTSSADLDWAVIDAKVEKWVTTPWPGIFGEAFYNSFPHEVLIEPMMGDPLKGLTDYKFFVFGGRTEFIQVEIDRHDRHRRRIFDRNWVGQPFSVRYPNADFVMPRPARLTQLIEAAEKLAGDFSFVRVDLYDLPEGPRFGEMTFTPGAGMLPFLPRSADLRWGQHWTAVG